MYSLLTYVIGKLSGHAVRIATELNLHQSFFKAMRGSPEHIEGATLWYLLYVCDHHFSIAYGRPPVIHDNETIHNHEKFLGMPGISQAHFRLHSQIAVFIILTRVYHTFSASDQMLAENDLNILHSFNSDLDTWREKWTPRLAATDYFLTYPGKAVLIHATFGKLQVSSLALRGIEQLGKQDLSPNRRKLADNATACAMALLTTIIEEPDIRGAIVGVPIYFHTMLTYSCVFLLKMQQRWKTYRLGIDPEQFREIMGKAICLMDGAQAGARHLAPHIAAGLTKMMDRHTAWEDRANSKPVVNEVKPLGHNLVANAQNIMVQTSDAGMNLGYEAFDMYDNPLQLFEDQCFPTGFFNVLYNGQFDAPN